MSELTGSSGNPCTRALITSAMGHVVAAVIAVTNVQIWRFGMNTPTATIQGPSAETPTTGWSGRSGRLVSMAEMLAATATSSTQPSTRIVVLDTSR